MDEKKNDCDADAARAALALAGFDGSLLEQVGTVLAALDALKAEVDRLRAGIDDVADECRERSTGPAEPDALWDVRRMMLGLVEVGE